LKEYGENGNTEVLYSDNQNSYYESIISDHRPVISKFSFKNSQSDEYIPIKILQDEFDSYKGKAVTIRGTVTIGSGILSNIYTSVYIQDSSKAGINIYYNSSVIADFP